MTNLILVDSYVRDGLLPLSFYRPVAEIRVGILTIREKWARRLGGHASHYTQDYLSRHYPTHIEKDNLLIAGHVLPTDALVEACRTLAPGHGLQDRGHIIAANIPGDDLVTSSTIPTDKLRLHDIDEITAIRRPADIFLLNEDQIRADFDLITRNRRSEPLPDHTLIAGNGEIFIEKGARMLAQSINTEDGPVYIGPNALIMEGAMIRGSAAFCHGSVVKMGAKIYKGTTIGPFSKVGGEISNSVFFGYSNKSHDGYLGNSVIAEWCNLGAGSNNSNLKNNYSTVKVWSYPEQKPVDTGLLFHGLIMGDHSKCGIDTMFNTGTVAGVHANFAGGGFTPKFIPSFTWNVAGDRREYDPSKAIQTAQTVMNRRSVDLTPTYHNIIEHLFRLTAPYRQAYLRTHEP